MFNINHGNISSSLSNNIDSWTKCWDITIHRSMERVLVKLPRVERWLRDLLFIGSRHLTNVGEIINPRD